MTSKTKDELTQNYERVRMYTNQICSTLKTEDYIIQTMEDVSPTKWHLAHTSWFFETFVLQKAISNYQVHHPLYPHLFNSYYELVGEPFPRPERGLLSRPTVEEVYTFRQYIDERMLDWFQSVSAEEFQSWANVIELGINHEQQHQELILTDIKHVLSRNPLHPIFREHSQSHNSSPINMRWIDLPEGIHEIGDSEEGFAYDNEGPRHRVFLEPLRFGSRLVTNREYFEFIEEGGYSRIDLWLSEAWDTINSLHWNAPLYWRKIDGTWFHFTLAGLREVDPHEPVCHVSYYEADAYARWAGARLPTEFEWEIATERNPLEGNLMEQENFHPIPLHAQTEKTSIHQMYGDVWEWTSSSYAPYPGYRPQPGALGEYNGKWMCNQYVLRGGSCATPLSHIRRTYRNFFPTHSRWQFMGIRLVKDERS